MEITESPHEERPQEEGRNRGTEVARHARLDTSVLKKPNERPQKTTAILVCINKNAMIKKIIMVHLNSIFIVLLFGSGSQIWKPH